MINLSKSGDTIVFEFINNGHYLDNGTIEVPVNSLSLVTDSSNMVTFYKADSNDIFISATYDELGKTKAEMLEWFEENMVAPQGGGGGGVTSGQVQTMIDDSVSGFADSVLYNSTSKYVEFYNGGTGGTKVYEFDASDFVIDGMVDDVRIETISGVSYLVIDFNTASGKEDIQIPLTDIFDPSNYYTKTEVDGIVSGKADSSDVTTQLNNKANKSAAVGGYKFGENSGKPYLQYTNVNTGNIGNEIYYPRINGKGILTNNSTWAQNNLNFSLVETSAITSAVTSASTDSEVPSAKAVYDALSGKTSVVNLTQAEYDALVTGGTVDPTVLYNITDATPIDMSQYWTSAQTNSAITQAVSGKQDTLSAGTGIEISGNVISATGGGGKAIEAGRGISITTGATADTVSFNLPISSDSQNNITTFETSNTIGGTSYITRNVLVGFGNTLNLNGSKSYANVYNLLFGNANTISKNSNSNSAYNTIFGCLNTISGHTEDTFICGYYNVGSKSYQVIGGASNNCINTYETAFGRYNVSTSASTTFGDSGNTLFSVGNGTADNAKHNALEIRQNGDIYYFDGTNDVKLQDKFSSLDTTIGNINSVLNNI